MHTAFCLHDMKEYLIADFKRFYYSSFDEEFEVENDSDIVFKS